MKLYSKLSLLLFSALVFCVIFINNTAFASKTENAVSLVNELLEEVSNIQKTPASKEQRRTEFLKLIHSFTYLHGF